MFVDTLRDGIIAIVVTRGERPALPSTPDGNVRRSTTPSRC
jgi:hypothetical protein